jgi:hypothetical protein
MQRKNFLFHACKLPLLADLEMGIKGNNIPNYNIYDAKSDLAELMTTATAEKAGFDFRKGGKVTLTRHINGNRHYTLVLTGVTHEDGSSYNSLLELES